MDDKIKANNDFLWEPRHSGSIPLWENVKISEWKDPQWQLKNSVRSVEQLKKVISLSDHQADEISRTVNELKKQGKETLRITPYYCSLMDNDPFHPALLKGDRSSKRLDPIFWQSVPTPANLLFQNTGKEGAMDEENRSYGAVYQRYPNRVALFVAENTSCASYCVHCQRAKSLDCTVDVNLEEIKKGLFYIAYNKNIDEVLVTGGDALRISSDRLRYVLEELGRIPHLRVIRIATRIPVVLPYAINEETLNLIKTSVEKYNAGIEKYVYFMTHINHYREITKDLFSSVKLIREFGFTVRNQTVLLNHVNDYFKTLAETFRRMLWIGVNPYYLLQCHKEKGIVHFITPIQVGKLYMKHLQGWISGITRPDYACNIEGGGGKVLLMPSGHDTLNLGNDIEQKISESFATVHTWDGKLIENYEALGRATRAEFDQAVAVMDRFIGRRGVFVPRIIIEDERGNIVETTNRTKLPSLTNLKKSKLLGYETGEDSIPLNNPQDIADILDAEFLKSAFIKKNYL
jgi:lysine 2,3-aminomutase